ncbi:RHOMBOID-like protein 1 [Humulus lupulus]|uniref:RHOMBOID-like protein 1 n=1 Tax=Humulus lupulus TaxID=3486 RepID=UPI002B40C9FB|nr:RHOMBOID-like protein 1 [Humulus lupulus]XP_062084970.1 RHOMBOID-like protein 1 [Humulus lupulus]
MERRTPSPAATHVQIKVQPRREDNVSHPDPVGASSRPSAAPFRSPSPPDDYKPFKRWTSWLVPSFVMVNIVLFAVTMFVNDCPKNSTSCLGRFLGPFSFQPMKENPLLGPSASALEKMGALEVDKVVHKHQAWRLITCAWLHAGVFHILANMLSLFFIGIRLEQEFGFARIGLLYIISGFGGSLLSALFIQSGISVGASGALFGLLGGMLSELITNWTLYANKLAALLTLIFIIVVNLAVGILPHVDNFAHIGGFFSGFLLGFIFLVRPQFRWVSQRFTSQGHTAPPINKHRAYQYALLIFSLILLIVGFIVGLIMLFQGVNLNERCSWCHYLSCVPTARWSCNSQKEFCEMIQFGNQLNMTCQRNGRNNIFQLSDNNPSQAQVQQLCRQLCS